MDSEVATNFGKLKVLTKIAFFTTLAAFCHLFRKDTGSLKSTINSNNK